MLIEFSVENFKSFRERVTLSMVAAARLHDDPQLDLGNVVALTPKLSLLSVAGIYGANASGKSNFVQAFIVFQRFVMNSTALDVERRPTAEPFRLSRASATEPSVFEVVFAAQGVQWRYGFAVSGQAIREEWLYVLRSSRETVLFEREGETVKRGASFRRGADLLDEGGRLNRPEALFLTLLAEIGVEEGKVVSEFVAWRCRSINGIQDQWLLRYTQRCVEAGRYVAWMQDLYRALDLGFSQLRVRTEEQGEEEGGKRPQSRLETIHALSDAPHGNEAEVSFPLTWESAGTQKIVALSGPLADTLDNGLTLFADELDARLHPKLTEYLIGLFQSKETNPKSAQLIFVTHDTNLLDARRFRRDQIWFVEKDRDGDSRLYSLAEFRGLRKDRDFEQDYLTGKFGALPFLSPLAAPVPDPETSDAPR